MSLAEQMMEQKLWDELALRTVENAQIAAKVNALYAAAFPKDNNVEEKGEAKSST